MGDLLEQHVSAFNLSYNPDSPHQSITVRRRYIWNDVQRCFSKPYTNLKVPIKVVFVGEPAADQGGPRREFLRLSLAAATSDATLFCGTPQSRVPIQNAGAVVKKSFLHVGWLISVSLTQGGPGPMCFAPWVYNYMCYGLDNTSIAVSDVPSSEAQSLLNKV